jgi:hypothetical protein
MKKIFYMLVVLSFYLFQPFAQDLRNSNSGPVRKVYLKKIIMLKRLAMRMLLKWSTRCPFQLHVDFQ